ncbi:hypothetical protein CUMW_278090 [Citrus unshiu]|uniref:Nicastrin n=1 Tax=Citrus unshiu TaxID=55188 RepID=A0A2H5N4I3_CITUN|nr:hypothetical protein CUMW_278090 [Citrus unshiu]
MTIAIEYLATDQTLPSPFLLKLLSKSHTNLIHFGALVYKTRSETRPRAVGPPSFSGVKHFRVYTNAAGSGIMIEKLMTLSCVLTSESETRRCSGSLVVRLYCPRVADKNEKVMNGYTTSVAEFDLVMQTTKAGTHDSESCLKEQTCLPLGGYSLMYCLMMDSVWSSLPPINMSSSYQSKPIILLVASMDSASFFRDKSLGADSPISGLLSLLAAVDALSRVDGWNDLNKQLVFLVLTGEAWGYLGSRRFLHELDMQSDGVSGLNSSLIEMLNLCLALSNQHGPIFAVNSRLNDVARRPSCIDSKLNGHVLTCKHLSISIARSLDSQ